MQTLEISLAVRELANAPLAQRDLDRATVIEIIAREIANSRRRFELAKAGLATDN